MSDLHGKRVAVVATNGFEESELTEPVKALREAGAQVDIVSQERKPIQGFKHHDKTRTVDVDVSLDEASPESYDALVLPGGALNADALRTDAQAQKFAREMNAGRKPVAVICHAPWLLVSAGLAEGRTLTSWPTIADDLRNAGAQWVDQEVVVDGNLVTSRGPKDLPAFNAALHDLLTRAPQSVS
ncbi:MAG TPA: type 1 glutamine amidotransferase domain-containing protein [Candidatus Cybelea sp.]|jgi:protease I|nr:type 1 glutamine amidotransferase domain-containing protein [Candidatus Cybelea sp.]